MNTLLLTILKNEEKNEKQFQISRGASIQMRTIRKNKGGIRELRTRHMRKNIRMLVFDNFVLDFFQK